MKTWVVEGVGPEQLGLFAEAMTEFNFDGLALNRAFSTGLINVWIPVFIVADSPTPLRSDPLKVGNFW